LPPPEKELRRFAWHPEPQLIGVLDEAVSREALERLGAATWSAALDYVYDEALRRAMGEPATYAELRRVFFGPSGGPARAPVGPTTSATLLEEFRTRLAPHQLNAWHPRSFSYFTPPPLVMSILGELLAQVTQQGVDVWHAGPSAAFVEEEVVRWLCDLVGYRAGSFGLLTSGGVMANFIALALVRDVRLRAALGNGRPPRGRDLEGVRVYASDQAHFSIARALDELGFPRDTLTVVAADERFRLRGPAVAEAIARDRAAGLRPLAVVATAGTVATGAVDPLPEIADLCARESLWMHVDGAYGGPAVLAEDLRPLFDGIDRADSIAFDPHKWMYTPHSGGCVLMRDARHLGESFAAHAGYVHEDKERTGHGPDLGMMGPQFSRGFQALKVWVSLLAHGRRAYARRISHDAELARYMAGQVRARPDLELAAPVTLSICCFRYAPDDLLANAAGRDEYLDELNERLMTAIQLDGRAYCSNAILHGRFVLRACIVNFRTEAGDCDATLDVATELGEKLDAELRPDHLRASA
jgi:aromatic-L-amino-acid decarboxylase